MHYFNNPKDIYQFINQEVGKLADRIQDLENSNLNIQSINAQNLHAQKEQLDNQQAYQIIKKLQADIGLSVHDLENNAEWKRFQIAFFGETNAGKSTIIETLRILLNEPTKAEQQRKFQEIANKLDISAEKFYQMEDELKSIEEKLNLINEQKSRIEQQYADELNLLTQQELNIAQKWDSQIHAAQQEYQLTVGNYQTKIDHLKEKIKDIKANMSWFLKIIYYFIKLDEQKELATLSDELKALEHTKDDKTSVLQRQKDDELSPISQQKDALATKQHSELQTIDDNAKSYEQNKQTLQQWFDEFDRKKEQLKPYLDGQIIGNGHNDFTRNNTSYQFEINQYPIAMIDVPGIEGNEKQVKDEISKSVQKAHAVFYVTNKGTPPNEGTLERIKTYLNDQTEVWAIYNKQITNPGRLNNQLIKGNDEKQSLNGLEEILKETLGEHYRGLMVLAGLPAFYSQVTCILPFSDIDCLKHFNEGDNEPLFIAYNQQQKFLDKHSRGGLYQFSELETLNQKLKNDIVGDVPAKIKKSNFNKVQVLVKKHTEELTKIHQTYDDFAQDLIKQVQLAQQSIKGYFDEFEIQLGGASNSAINNCIQKIRSQIYKKINNDIDNDDFKRHFDNIVQSEIQVFEQDIKTSIDEYAKKLEENTQKSQKDLLRNINELSKDYQQYSQLNNSGVELKFNIDNGINTKQLFGVGIGILATMWWNPVGWFAIAATVSGLAIAFAKAVWGFFDSDYKKEQQRKNVDSNLPKITDALKSEINNSLSELAQKMNENKQKILIDLNEITKPISVLNEDLAKTIRSLDKISADIAYA
ncbi:hypothetical protein ACFBZI_06425 [Moraxella sp. ZJ142]|uniref:hypothetical protein n=1 Tax=Moraxella marmotae TaxID=3344520 RepID=UPI0035D44CE7